MRPAVVVVLLGSILGCSTRSPLPPSNPPPSGQLWTPSLSVEQARTLSPGQAKAILVARAALERQAKAANDPAPAIMSFRVDPVDGGWSVYVQFVGAWVEGRPFGAPSYFCVVYLDPNWNVTRIVGGA